MTRRKLSTKVLLLAGGIGDRDAVGLALQIDQHWLGPAALRRELRRALTVNNLPMSPPRLRAAIDAQEPVRRAAE
jgi:hypothetical protein